MPWTLGYTYWRVFNEQKLYPRVFERPPDRREIVRYRHAATSFKISQRAVRHLRLGGQVVLRPI
jgi:hypothetical protein